MAIINQSRPVSVECAVFMALQAWGVATPIGATGSDSRVELRLACEP